MGKMLVFAALVFLFGLHIDASAATSKKMFTRRLIFCVIVLLIVFVRPLSAVVTYVAAGTVATGTTTITPALPAGTVTGDILLLFVETPNRAVTISNQNGGTWTEVLNSPQGTGTAGAAAATRLTAFWSRYNGSQGAPTTNSASSDQQIGRILGFRGVVASGNPWDVTAGNVASTASTSVSIPGATTTVANTLVVAVVANTTDTTTAQTGSWANSNLTSFAERTDDSTSTGNGGGFGVATGGWATAGAYGTTTATLTTSSTQGRMSIALKPATPPGQATNPTPTNGATNVSLTQDINWAAGSGAATRDVYFGTVTPPVTKVISDGNALTYDTGTMAPSTTYYWRVDEKNADGNTAGVVWSFTTTPVMYWSGNFSPSPIALAHIASRAQTSEGSSQATLTTSGNAVISADNTATARLTKAGGANLYTEYKLVFDGDGVSKTGRSTVNYTSYDLFLNSPATVTHVAGDNDVIVTLYARASNYTGQLADAGNYSATQTLTVSWAGP